MAAGQITREFQSQWYNNPKLAYKMHWKWAFSSSIKRWQESYKIIGFVDGSWKTTAIGPQLGIGGFTIDHLGSVKFIFSGPITNCIGWEVELRAMHFICSALQEKFDSSTSCCIATDSKTLYDHLQRVKANLHVCQTNIELLKEIVNMDNIHIEHINRTQNGATDFLAKEGAKRISMLSGWV